MNFINTSLTGFTTSMLFTLFIVIGSDTESMIYEEGFSKWNIIPFAYLIDITNWASMTCDEKREHMKLSDGTSIKEQMSTLPQNFLEYGDTDKDHYNPSHWRYSECVRMENQI